MNQELYWRRISCMICIVGIFLILLLYIILRCETAQITIENKNELVGDKFAIRGENNTAKIYVEINGSIIDSIRTKNNTFEYEVDTNLLNNGWNYISFIARTYIPLSESRCGGAINVIKEQANVFVPDDIISIARLSGNYNLNKPFEPYLINNYTYYDYYFNLPILEENASLKFDESGIAIVKYEDGYHYNPVTVAQQALGYYNHYQRTGDDKSLSAFFNDSEWFIDN